MQNLNLDSVLFSTFKIVLAPTSTGGIVATVVFKEELTLQDQLRVREWVNQLNSLRLFESKENNRIPVTYDSMIYSVVEKTVFSVSDALNNIQ